ncbi:MAG: glycosyltransferase family 4 protein [Actinomycetota bacterium]
MKEPAGTFCTLFPGYRDYHFYKDPGQLPYRASKLGYNTLLVCYGRGRLYPETEKHLRIRTFSESYISRKFNAAIICFLLFNSRRIDILNVFHITWSSLLFVFIYRMVNRRGFAYLKLDNCVFSGTYPWEVDYVRDGKRNMAGKSLRQRIRSFVAIKFFLDKVSLFSVEDEYSREEYEKRYKFFRGKLITVCNGHTSDLPDSPGICDISSKEEIILTAGRLGTYQKATEVLLQAFRLAAPGNSYKLHLAGSVEPSFTHVVEEFMDDNPELKERVIFHDALRREELYHLYNRSRIFCMSSRYEGMAIVFPEAMIYRNAIVTTWPVSLKYFIDRYEVGIATGRDDPEDMARALRRLIEDDSLRLKMAAAAYETASGLMNWDVIVSGLMSEIRKRASNELH